jgi:hypothetical protein
MHIGQILWKRRWIVATKNWHFTLKWIEPLWHSHRCKQFKPIPNKKRQLNLYKFDTSPESWIFRQSSTEEEENVITAEIYIDHKSTKVANKFIQKKNRDKHVPNQWKLCNNAIHGVYS